MRKAIYYILISIFIIGIPLFAFGIVNTMVSIKYETADMGDCISSVSGVDLCLTIKILKGLIAVCAVGLISLIIFRKKILNQK
ncbi:hypothetical protein [Alistipes sp. ZOR0009]|uniref:hypothetical protein n=1 Tax=Alistipes sp. ZOR0009 TaxID=1339253 RepID=UPI0006471299|nr:hypothetical protein [Alistipes sp. ZOR0009]